MVSKFKVQNPLQSSHIKASFSILQNDKKLYSIVSKSKSRNISKSLIKYVTASRLEDKYNYNTVPDATTSRKCLDPVQYKWLTLTSTKKNAIKLYVESRVNIARNSRAFKGYEPNAPLQ